ncbi:hypothetical protein ACSBR2_034863 [Camellia fascicularis]
MTGLVKFMKSTKFTEAQLGYLQQTPFWNLLDALRNNQIDLDKCMKYDDVVVHVLQMYKASKDAFYIGEKKMNIHNSGIKLIFGVDCGSKPIDISYGAKPKTGIVNKICKNVSRLTSKWIRTLLTEVLKGKKKADNEEVARLVCMYACQKLFFSTSGETIGWGYYAHMVPLETMREYDWAKQIRTTLTSSISQNDKNPAKVTGCVMLLMSSPPNINTEIRKCMEQKDEEIKRLTQLVIDLECDKTILQDLYDDQSVHIVTQAVAEKHPPSPMQHNISPPSRVKRTKEKDRKEHRLPDFQYPDLPGQKQPHPVEMVEDVEKHPPAKPPKKLSLTNKFKVWSKIDTTSVNGKKPAANFELLLVLLCFTDVDVHSCTTNVNVHIHLRYPYCCDTMSAIHANV